MGKKEKEVKEEVVKKVGVKENIRMGKAKIKEKILGWVK